SQRIERVGDGDDPGAQRDFFTAQVSRISAAIPSFVVVQHQETRMLKVADGAHGRPAPFWMFADPTEFLVVEFAVLEEDAIGDADLSNVMQGGGEDHLIEVLLR